MKADVCSKTSAAASLDTRYVFGMTCTWHGSIQDASYCFASATIESADPDAVEETPAMLPCCPHCGSMLMEVASEEEWKASVQRDCRSHPEYAAMIFWAKGKCYPDADTLQNAYRQAMEE